jgi:hypothetical protein
LWYLINRFNKQLSLKQSNGIDVHDIDPTKICLKIFLEVMLKQEELDQLRQYNFDLAITEMVDFCGVSLMRYIGIKNHIWLSTTPIHDVVLHSLGRYIAFPSINFLGIPSPPSYVPVSEESQFGPIMTFKERIYNLYMYLAIYRIFHMSVNHVRNMQIWREKSILTGIMNFFNRPLVCVHHPQKALNEYHLCIDTKT